jgi:hypothetical protein
VRLPRLPSRFGTPAEIDEPGEAAMPNFIGPVAASWAPTSGAAPE